MRTRRGLLLAAFIFAVSSAVQGGDKPTIYVVTHDRKILLDEKLDQLIEQLLVRPDLKLATAKGYSFSVRCEQKECALDSLIDKYYDYYRSKFGHTTTAIADWIRVQNHLSSDVVSKGTSLQFPAIAVKPNEDFHVAGSRVFNPRTTSYVSGTGIDTLAFHGKATTPIAKRNDRRRQVNETVTALSIEDYKVKYGGHPAPVAYMDVYYGAPDATEQRRVQVHLFSGGSGAMTPNFESPYRTIWLNKWSSEGTDIRRADLMKSANDRHFIVVDWDFDEAQGHGKAVMAVARAVLKETALDFLTPEHFELNPLQNTDGLIAAMDEYCEFRNEVCTSEGSENPNEVSALQAQYRAGYRWIKHPDIKKESDVQNIDGFVLKTALWHLFRTGSWLNLSFQVTPSDASVVFDQVLADSPAIAFVAAGNDSAPVLAAYFPQGIARLQPGHFANVTFGAPDGTVSGSYSMIAGAERADVALIAKGSQFTIDGVAADAHGSSFASPVVSAAAWAFSLMHPDIDNTTVVKYAVQASRPITKLQHPVSSGGYFDPFLLLLQSGPRLVATNGTVQPITGGEFSFRYIDPEDMLEKPGVIHFDHSRSGIFRVYRNGAQIRLWRRTVAADTGDPVLSDVELRGGTANLLLDGLAAPTHLSIDELADGYQEISY